MPILTREWRIDNPDAGMKDIEEWLYSGTFSGVVVGNNTTIADADAVGSNWQISMRAAGKNVNTALTPTYASLYDPVTTASRQSWEKIGVPAGANVTAIRFSYSWRCSEWTTGVTGSFTRAECYFLTPTGGSNGGGGNILANQTFAAVTNYARRTSAWMAVPAAGQASNQHLAINVTGGVGSGNSNSAVVALLVDWFVLEIDYMDAGPAVYDDLALPLTINSATALPDDQLVATEPTTEFVAASTVLVQDNRLITEPTSTVAAVSAVAAVDARAATDHVAFTAVASFQAPTPSIFEGFNIDGAWPSPWSFYRDNTSVTSAVTDGVGRLVLPNAGFTGILTHLGPVEDGEVLFRYRFTATDIPQRQYVQWRSDDPGSSWLPGKGWGFGRSGNSTGFSLWNFNGGGQQQIGGTKSWPIDTDWWWVRIRLDGPDLKLRIWKAGTTEPATWVWDLLTDGHTSSGALRIVATGGGAAGGDVQVDDVMVVPLSQPYDTVALNEHRAFTVTSAVASADGHVVNELREFTVVASFAVGMSNAWTDAVAFSIASAVAGSDLRSTLDATAFSITAITEAFSNSVANEATADSWTSTVTGTDDRSLHDAMGFTAVATFVATEVQGRVDDVAFTISAAISGGESGGALNEFVGFNTAITVVGNDVWKANEAPSVSITSAITATSSLVNNEAVHFHITSSVTGLSNRMFSEVDRPVAISSFVSGGEVLTDALIVVWTRQQPEPYSTQLHVVIDGEWKPKPIWPT